MGHDFIDDLLNALKRVVTPDASVLRDILILSGMPEKTQNLCYLGYNQQRITEGGRTIEFSAVAVINNRRAPHWRLEGYAKKLSQIVFSTRWTRNPLDLFLNNIRCNAALMDILAVSEAPYTLLGILQVQERAELAGKQVHCYVRPLLALPCLDGEALDTVAAFEKQNEIRSSGIKGISLYRKTPQQVTGR